MTDTVRTRVLHNVLDAADSLAVAAAAAAAGLTTYRALNGRPAETRLALALAAAGAAGCCTDQLTAQLRRPLRRSLGLTSYSCAPVPAQAPITEQLVQEPTGEQLAEDVAADAAHRAAAAATVLDRSSGCLTRTANWTGAVDGTATCELPGGAHLLCVPSPADEFGYTARSFTLVREGRQSAPVRSIGDLVALLALDADDLPADQHDDPWTAIGAEIGIAELLPADTGTDPVRGSTRQETQRRTGGNR